ncbi:MAG: SRPBCC family protein [Flavobacteriales bacterium]|nr:SRPBCC family protein [Flavobacteriales bacterium]
MRALKTLLIILVAVIALGAILGLIGPKRSIVTRSVVIHATAPVVYAHASSLQRMEEWNPWNRKDANSKLIYSGQTVEVGQDGTWREKDEASSEIDTGLVPNKRVKLEVHFSEPYQQQAELELKLNSLMDSTHVTWTFESSNDFFKRIYLVFNDIDTIIGPDLQDGLKQLRSLAELDAIKLAEEDKANTYRGFRIETVERPEVTYAGKRDMVKWGGMGAYFSKVFPQSKQAIEKADVKLAGGPTALYYKRDTVDRKTDVFAGAPITAGPDVRVPGCEIVTVPAGKALMIAYNGSPEKSKEAHEAIYDMMKAKGLKLRSPVVEEFVTDPGQEPDTTKWVTNIYYPVE